MNIADDIGGWTFGISRTTQQTTSGNNWQLDGFSREVTERELLYEICEISGDVNEEWNEWPQWADRLRSTLQYKGGTENEGIVA